MKSCQISVSCKKSLVIEIIHFEWNAYCWCCCKWLGPTHRADSDPVVVCCDTPRGIWKQMMKYCKLHWSHRISGVTSCWWWCLCWRQISLSRHLHTKYVWAFFCWADGCPPPPPRGIFWGPGAAKINIIFQSLWDWTGIAAAALSSCLSDLGATRSTYMAWSCGSRGPRDLAVGFLAAQLTGVLNNQLEYIARNMYIYYFVIEPSSLFCTDVRTCVIISSMYSLYIRWINDFWFWFWFWLWFWLNHLRAVSDMLTFLSEWKIFGSAIGWHDDK